MIVENIESSRLALQKILEEFGHEVIVMGNGREAWECLQNSTVRMVITDWTLEEMDGLELCRNIREANLSNYIYTILLTDKDQINDIETGFESGIDDYIIKPFDPRELKGRILAGKRIIELEDEHKKIQMHLLQSEKMASIGLLAAGVAHEINNPIGYVYSNLNSLDKYVSRLNEFIAIQSRLLQSQNAEEITRVIEQKRKELKIDYIVGDIKDMIEEASDGASRVKKIVQDLKSFSRIDGAKCKYTNINDCLDDTINIINNELKYVASLTKEYGDISALNCNPQQLNQVFMNLLINASHAIETQGEITIKTWEEAQSIYVSISDTGCGIPEENVVKIFEPFFTTKEIGKGTGLGLSISYDIIKKHKGDIEVKSEVGKGTEFRIRLPLTGNDENG